MIAVVSGLIRRLDVNVNEIFVLKRFQRMLGLARVVGVVVTGGTGNGNDIQSNEPSDAVDKIDGGDDRSRQAELVLERRQIRPLALPPKPDGVGRLVL